MVNILNLQKRKTNFNAICLNGFYERLRPFAFAWNIQDFKQDVYGILFFCIKYINTLHLFAEHGRQVQPVQCFMRLSLYTAVGARAARVIYIRQMAWNLFASLLFSLSLFVELLFIPFWRFQIEVQNIEIRITHSPLSFWRGDAQAAGAASSRIYWQYRTKKGKPKFPWD